MHREHPLRTTVDRASLASRFGYLKSDALIGALLQRMAAAGRIELADRGVALAGHEAQLSSQQRETLRRILDTYRRAAYQPPPTQQVKSDVSRNPAVAAELIALAASEGQLVQIAADLYLDAEAERKMRETLAEHLADGDGLTVSQIREILDTSRKYAVPLCEYLDRIRFTKRQGDVRVLCRS